MTDRPSISHQISTTARAVLSGELGIVEGCRQLTRLASRVEREDEPFLTIIAVESETEGLPLGETRKFWNAEALAEKDAKFDIYVSKVREMVLEACEELVRQYSVDE